MSQAAFLRSFDALAGAAFLGAGLADRAAYLSPEAQAALAAHAAALAAYQAALAAYDPLDPLAGPPPVAPSAEGLPVAVPCTVMVDRDVQDFSEADLAPVSARQTLVAFQRAEVEPAGGGLVEVVGYPGAMRLVRRARVDESRSVWEVEHVQPA